MFLFEKRVKYTVILYILANKATGLQELNYHYFIINHVLTEFKMNVKNFFTKVTVVLLACLLVFMGIGNLLSGDDEKEEVARVGKEVITPDEYKSLYQNYEKQISGSDASREQVKKLKYDLLNALIEQKLLFNLISELGLTVGEVSKKNHIKNTKYFQNDKGEFDRNNAK